MLHRKLPLTTSLSCILSAMVLLGVWQIEPAKLQPVSFLLLPALGTAVLAAAFGYRFYAAVLSMIGGLVAAFPVWVQWPGPVYVAAAVVIAFWVMTAITASPQSKHAILAYLLLLNAAAAGLAWLALMSGSNTQGGDCAWVEEAEANWSWNGSPCRMDWDAFFHKGLTITLGITFIGFAPFAAVAIFFTVRQIMQHCRSLLGWG